MRAFVYAAVCLALLSLLPACDDHERLNKLEKENAELRAKVEKQSASENFDLQQKCSQAAERFLMQGWRRDKDTILLHYTNHYNQKQNICVIYVEEHTRMGQGEDWWNVMSVWNVFENYKIATIQVDNYPGRGADRSTLEEVVDCKADGKACKTKDEYFNIIRPLMNE